MGRNVPHFVRQVSAIVAGEPWVRLSPSPGGVKAGPDDLEFGEVVSLPDPELPFEEASMSFSAAGEWLVSSLSDATIAAVGADGSVRWPREARGSGRERPPLPMLRASNPPRHPTTGGSTAASPRRPTATTCSSPPATGSGAWKTPSCDSWRLGVRKRSAVRAPRRFPACARSRSTSGPQRATPARPAPWRWGARPAPGPRRRRPRAPGRGSPPA